MTAFVQCNAFQQNLVQGCAAAVTAATGNASPWWGWPAQLINPPEIHAGTASVALVLRAHVMGEREESDDWMFGLGDEGLPALF